MMSSMCSVPMERRMVDGVMPEARSSCSFIWLCVVDAGWMTRDFTSATLARRLKTLRWSMNFFAASAPPLISNVKMEMPPLGKYFS